MSVGVWECVSECVGVGVGILTIPIFLTIIVVLSALRNGKPDGAVIVTTPQQVRVLRRPRLEDLAEHVAIADLED